MIKGVGRKGLILTQEFLSVHILNCDSPALSFFVADYDGLQVKFPNTVGSSNGLRTLDAFELALPCVHSTVKGGGTGEAAASSRYGITQAYVSHGVSICVHISW